nr:MAG TPA: hypothetical protein [Caudoviricetes sp.]DAW89297.1 MAG TPA: hypothetical protein [Caudoviricetes sp.]
MLGLISLRPLATLLCFLRNRYFNSSSGLLVSNIKSFLPILIAKVSQNVLLGDNYPSG